MVISTVEVTAVSATDVAVTVMELGVGAVVGAVYKPVFGSMVPSEPAVVTVGSDQVTLLHVGLEVMIHPGLFTVAMKPLVVTVGIFAGAVYSPVESMVPQAGAVTPVGQVTVQVTVVLLFPVTRLENCRVRFVITLACTGEIVSETVELAELPPQPSAPSAIARVSPIELIFHHLIPVLPSFAVMIPSREFPRPLPSDSRP